MNYCSNESTQSQNYLESGSFVSIKDYFVGEDNSKNPYASIDDFLDETWNLYALPQGEIKTTAGQLH